MQYYAIIVAGGKGQRMKSTTPKQFLLLNGMPVLMITMQQFFKYNNKIKIIVVLPHDQINKWKQLIAEHRFQIPHKIQAGGNTRFYSVKNGLQHVHDDGVVAIHDGVRPLVSLQTISHCFEAACQKGAIVPVIDCVESLRISKNGENKAVHRADYKIIQTPQTFLTNVILPSYNVDYKDSFTDDATVVEENGHNIHFVEGNRENIKITTAMDMQIAECLLLGDK